MAAYDFKVGASGAVADSGVVDTTGSLKAFFTSAFTNDAEAYEFIEMVSPLMYHITDAFVVHMIVDGHAHDEASLTLKAVAVNAGETVTEATTAMLIS